MRAKAKTPQTKPLFSQAEGAISDRFSPEALVSLHVGDRLELLRQIPDGAARLVVTSPPYNIGKSYEKQMGLDSYLRAQKETLAESVRILAEDGSLCWQVGNHLLSPGEICPLDILIYPICKELGLKLRNRIVWHFEHGLHCSKRFSGRYETILWFTKSEEYVFHLDPVRVPQKYPGKRYFKGPRVGQISGNPLGKNPADVWVIPNVKHNHPEKTIHPCQFPVELIARFVLALTNGGDLVVDPYMGVGSTACAAVLCGRRAAGSDTDAGYIYVARDRVEQALSGTLKIRPMDRPVYEPDPKNKLARRPAEFDEAFLIDS